MYRSAAIIILILFYTIYYGKMIVQKMHGIRTDQIMEQDKGTERSVGVIMSIAAFSAGLADIISVVVGVTQLPAPFRALGLFLAASGDMIFLISVITMGDSWRAGVSRKENTDLVTKGIYRISRNPAFLGFDLVYTGILLMFFSRRLLVFTMCAVIMLHLQIILVEEPYLRSAFGRSYREYCKKVHRYV